MRCSTVRCLASFAIMGMLWMPELPVPITATRLSVVNSAFRVPAGEVDLAFKIIFAVNLALGRQRRNTGDEELASIGGSGVSWTVHMLASSSYVRPDRGLELDVLCRSTALDVVGVLLDLGLARHDSFHFA